MSLPSAPTRRRFLQAAAVTPLVYTATARAAATDRITLGFIGVGTMGRGHLGSFLKNPDVQVIAVCDVVAERRESARKMADDAYAKDVKGDYKGCQEFTDFRKLLDVKGLDAVVIATPDHWHAIPCIAAARAKKDIYCEKPLTRFIAEGRKVVEEVTKAKIVFQTGSQQRSEFANRFRDAVERVRNGLIGKVKTVRIGVGEPAIACDLPEQAIPKGTDWDLWLGPAPKRGYNEILCPKGVHQGFPAWRRYREYAGGGLADMGAHHFDIAQWALDMDASGPVKIEPPTDKKRAGLRFVYANGVEMFHGGPADCVFEGTDGKILVSRGKLESDPASILKEKLPEKAWKAYPSDNHRKNWVECIKGREETICPAEVGHRSASICHLANIGYQLGKSLTWDPGKERFTDEEANKLVDRELREPWTL